MKQALRADDTLTQTDKALQQMLLGDYRQASSTLNQLAVAFRTRESQLRKLIESSEQPLFASRIDAARQSNDNGRALTIAFFCLGKFRIEARGTIVNTRGRSNALKILKFLAQRHRPCTSEMLIETLWPENEFQAASNRLRVEIHSLRQILAASVNVPDVIVYHDGCYELNPEIDYWSDADDFETIWHQGARLEANSHNREAAQHYEQAASLYLGDYLEEDLYEEWTLFRRESLRDGYLYLLGKLAGWYLEEGNHGSCISYSHKILTQDPYREDAYRLLMNSYNALGQKATALRWYEVCRTNLQKGLDVTPSPETSSLKNRIITADEL